MEMETSTDSSSSTQEAPQASQETSQAQATPTAGDSQGSTRGHSQGLTLQQEPQAPAWVPNYKYKVGEKEMEFDDYIRPIVNKDNEAKVRDLYTRAMGLDSVKQRLHDTSRDLKTFKSENETRTKYLNQLSGFINNKDLGSFFKNTQIPEEMVYNWVLEQIKYKELDPQHKSAYDDRNKYRTQAMEQEQRLQDLEQRYSQTTLQQRHAELDQALQRSEVSQIGRAYDERVGRPGAFRNKVIETGAFRSQQLGQEISVDDAVGEMVREYGAFITTNAPAGQIPTQVMGSNRPPVIPVVGGGNTSPIERAPKSLDDLRKLAQQKYG